VRSEDIDFRAGGRLVSLSELSDVGCDSFFSTDPLLKSNADPGVFGVLPEEPKLAKAPLPNPNAEDAPEPAVGEATDAAEMEPGGPLKGLVLLLKDPYRLADGGS
jgi:hypothetical protein